MDLGAERVISAEKGSEKIIVEIKTFIQASFIHAFHEATGQYDNYLLALEEIAPDRLLYLAIPEDIWNGYFQERFIKKVVSRKTSSSLFTIQQKKLSYNGKIRALPENFNRAC